MNIRQKVFYKGSQMSKEEHLKYLSYCYKKYNNIENEKSYGKGVNESDDRRKQK